MKLTKIFNLFFILTLYGFANLFGQDSTQKSYNEPIPDSTFIIEKIIITGNSTTKDFVILREMTLQPGSYLTQHLLDYDQNRIYSLGLFNQVQIKVIPSSADRVILIVEVSERWYIFPIPIIGIKDRDWSKAYYGLGLLHNNFRGRNEKLFFMCVLGYDRSIAISYRNPFLTDNGTTFLEARFGYYKIRNKSLISRIQSVDFDENHNSVSLTLGKRPGIAHTVWITAGYEVVSVSENAPDRTISNNGRDIFPLFGIGYNYDTRDLAEYPSYGTYLRAVITKFGLPSNKLDIIRYSADLRQYSRITQKLIITGRIFTEVTAGGRTPSYNRVYLGYNERIRGHFHEIQEGENLLGISSELHFTLLEPIYKKIDFMPPEFGTFKFGIVAAVFGDAGTAWFRSIPLKSNNLRKGYGFGLHFLLPYSIVLRTEYAFNENRSGEFIIDLGSMF